MLKGGETKMNKKLIAGMLILAVAIIVGAKAVYAAIPVFNNSPVYIQATGTAVITDPAGTDTTVNDVTIFPGNGLMYKQTDANYTYLPEGQFKKVRGLKQ